MIEALLYLTGVDKARYMCVPVCHVLYYNLFKHMSLLLGWIVWTTDTNHIIIYIYTYIYIYICVCVCVRACVRACVRVCVYIHTFIDVHVFMLSVPLCKQFKYNTDTEF